MMTNDTLTTDDRNRVQVIAAAIATKKGESHLADDVLGEALALLADMGEGTAVLVTRDAKQLRLLVARAADMAITGECKQTARETPAAARMRKSRGKSVETRTMACQLSDIQSEAVSASTDESYRARQTSGGAITGRTSDPLSSADVMTVSEVMETRRTLSACMDAATCAGILTGAIPYSLASAMADPTGRVDFDSPIYGAGWLVPETRATKGKTVGNVLTRAAIDYAALADKSGLPVEDVEEKVRSWGEAVRVRAESHRERVPYEAFVKPRRVPRAVHDSRCGVMPIHGPRFHDPVVLSTFDGPVRLSSVAAAVAAVFA